MRVRVEGLTKSFGTARAAENVTFEAESGAFLTLLGASGSGKTTILRCIAGVETPDSGTISIGDRTVFSNAGDMVLPESRNVGMVYQSFALWPHMTVFDNVAYPLKIRKSRDIASKVDEMLALLKLTGLEGRHPYELSGGQQQRVAIARALVYRPVVLLLDEPFSNLDIPLRLSLLDEIRQLQEKLETTVIYVTHDRADALAVSDSMIVMSAGRVIASGSPTELVRNPPNSYVASFVAGMLVADAELVGLTDQRAAVKTEFGEFEIARTSARPGPVKLCIGSVKMEVSLTQRPNSITGRISGVSARPGRDAVARVTTGLGTVETEIGREQEAQLAFGTTVHLVPDPTSCLVLPE